MEDRMQFTETVLKNGIRLFHKKFPVDFIEIHIVIPVGTANNLAPIRPGTFHFLEHLLCERSQKFPQRLEFAQKISLVGGWLNATTDLDTTSYSVSAPSSHADLAIEGLISAIFEPKFHQDDIAINREIIKNERQARVRWYPGRSEIGQYLRKNWVFDQAVELNQIFGSPEDLVAMNEADLSRAHQAYFDKRVMVFTVGSGDTRLLHSQLEKLKLVEHRLPAHTEPLRWVNRDYHEKTFRDLSRYELEWGGFTADHVDPALYRQLNFLLQYLTNSVHGPLYTWLRHEKGWLYNIDSYHTMNNHQYDWNITFPLRNIEEVRVVHQELHGRIRRALQDKAGLQKEVDRLLGASVYWAQTADGIVSSAIDNMEEFGQMVTLAQWQELIKSCGDSARLMELYEKYFSEEVSGCFAAIPES